MRVQRKLSGGGRGGKGEGDLQGSGWRWRRWNNLSEFVAESKSSERSSQASLSWHFPDMRPSSSFSISSTVLLSLVFLTLRQPELELPRPPLTSASSTRRWFPRFARGRGPHLFRDVGVAHPVRLVTPRRVSSLRVFVLLLLLRLALLRCERPPNQPRSEKGRSLTRRASTPSASLPTFSTLFGGPRR